MIHPYENVLKRFAEFGLMSKSEEDELYIFLLWIDQNVKDSPYMTFIGIFNKHTGKRYKGDAKSRKLFYESFALYSLADYETIMKNAMTDKYLRENDGILRPEFITKSENLAKYINYKPTNTIQHEPDQDKRNYSEPPQI